MKRKKLLWVLPIFVCAWMQYSTTSGSLLTLIEDASVSSQILSEKVGFLLRQNSGLLPDATRLFHELSDRKKLLALARGLALFRTNPDVRSKLLESLSQGDNQHQEMALMALAGDSSPQVLERTLEILDTGKGKALSAATYLLAEASDKIPLTLYGRIYRAIERRFDSDFDTGAKMDALDVYVSGPVLHAQQLEFLKRKLLSEDLTLSVRLNLIRVLYERDAYTSFLGPIIQTIAGQKNTPALLRKTAETLARAPHLSPLELKRELLLALQAGPPVLPTP